MDELAHIPAGYSYITQKDMRLNPEHPPLLKDLAGLAVWLGSKITATPIHFPSQIKPWQKDINGQWDFGGYFLYRNGNDADKIIFWARLPMLLIMLLLGFYVFKWTSELYGSKAGLLALFFYSISPTFLAHGRLVTTDVGAAAAFFIAAYYLIKWLRQPTKKNLIIAGLVFGLAMLTKFSLALLIPYFVVLVVVWVLIKKDGNNPQEMSFSGVELRAGTVPLEIIKDLIKSLGCLLLIGLIGMALIWPIYQYHVWNYPPAKQQADTEFILQSFGNRTLAETVTWMADKPILRPYAQYFLGLLMVMQRATGGNTTYFLGEVSAAGWWYYFPVVFLIKIPLAFLILLFIALLSAAYQIKKPFWSNPLQRVYQWTKTHFVEFAFFSFIVLYWSATLKSNLNIGIRHILPTFPFLYVLVSGQIINWLKIKFPHLELSSQKIFSSLNQFIKSLCWLWLKIYFKYFIIILLLCWYAFGTIKIYPHFLTYFNELVGGPSNGYKYAVDSNLDWGQDLKRLAQFVEKNKIEKIYLDYFGGGSAEYYLKEKYQPWWGSRQPSELPPNSWLAVSATLLQGGRGWPVPGFHQPTGYYNWLNQYQPAAKIGYSIFVYKIE
jgi:hypothetical protein